MESFRPKIEVTLPEIRQVVKSFLEASERHGVRCIDLEESISELLLRWIYNNQKILLEELGSGQKNLNYTMNKLFSALFQLFDPILTQDRITISGEPNQRIFAFNAWIYALFALFRDKFNGNNF